MTQQEAIIWFAGLFEGEGSFVFYKNKRNRGLALSSTDLDVLQNIVHFFGGTIYELTKRKQNWKDAWLWRGNPELSVELYPKIRPFLHSRRKEKGDLWLAVYNDAKADKDKNEEKRINVYEQIRELLVLNKTHQEIANLVGYERSTVTKIINNYKK